MISDKEIEKLIDDLVTAYLGTTFHGKGDAPNWLKKRISAALQQVKIAALRQGAITGLLMGMEEAIEIVNENKCGHQSAIAEKLRERVREFKIIDTTETQTIHFTTPIRYEDLCE